MAPDRRRYHMWCSCYGLLVINYKSSIFVESDIEDNRKDVEGINSLNMTKTRSKDKQNGDVKNEKKKRNLNDNTKTSDDDVNDLDEELEIGGKFKSRNRERPKVRFQVSPRGKVNPSESRTGKAPVKRKGKHSTTNVADIDGDVIDDGGNMLQYDQTLAGTFADVADVFGKFLVKVCCNLIKLRQLNNHDNYVVLIIYVY